VGYNIHIHRREDWSDPEGDSISLDEWTALIANDPTLIVDGSVVWADRDSGPNLDTPTAEWSGPGGVTGLFYWYDGNIEAKNPAPAVIVKAHEMATKLTARLQGDDGEFYGADGKAYYYEPGDNDLPAEPEAPTRSASNWWERLFKK